jgi:hypothetical protein
VKGPAHPATALKVAHWLALGRAAIVAAHSMPAGSGEGFARVAALLLHQACEFFLSAIVVVNACTHGPIAPARKAALRAELRIVPQSAGHDLLFLRALALEHCAAVGDILPLGHDLDRQRFERLRRAYTRSRYSLGPPPLPADDERLLLAQVEGLGRFAEQLAEHVREPVREAA